MARPQNIVIEQRSYDLSPYFPILLLTGDHWRISDIPSKRLHFHNCLEIGLCESDSGIMEFIAKKVPFHNNDITFIASDIPHTTYSSPGTKSKWTYIFVDIEELFCPFFPLDFLPNQELFTQFLHGYSTVIASDLHPDIAIYIRCIVRNLVEQPANYQFIVRGLFLSLTMAFLNLYSADLDASPKKRKENSMVVAPALDYMRTNYMMDFPMDSLSELCHLSPTHFRRTFRQIMGKSPLEYLIHLRITKASALLRTTEMSILDISEAVGFRSVSSFNRHFREIMNDTPKNWRGSMSFLKNKSLLKYNGWMMPEIIPRDSQSLPQTKTGAPH